MISVANTTKRRPPKIPLENTKNEILGRRYELSLVFCAHALSRRLNRQFRGKDKPTNILSFPLSGSSGEIFIDLAQAEKEHPKFGEKYSEFVLRLFIHGLLHLKGMDHGDTMEKAETKFLNRFSLTKK